MNRDFLILSAIAFLSISSLYGAASQPKLENAATNSSTTTLYDNTELKRTTEKHIKQKKESLINLLKAHLSDCAHLVVEYEGRNSLYPQFGTFTTSAVTQERLNALLNPELRTGGTFLLSAREVEPESIWKAFREIRAIINPSGTYNAMYGHHQQTDLYTLMVADTLHHRPCMVISSGIYYFLVDKHNYGRLQVAINDTHVAALVASRKDPQLFICVWRIGKLNPEYVLPVPLDNDGSSLGLVMGDGYQPMLSLSAGNTHKGYIALYLPNKKCQTGILYRWKLGSAAGQEPAKFSIPFSHNNNLLFPAWLKVFHTGKLYLFAKNNDVSSLLVSVEEDNNETIIPLALSDALLERASNYGKPITGIVGYNLLDLQFAMDKTSRMLWPERDIFRNLSPHLQTQLGPLFEFYPLQFTSKDYCYQCFSSDTNSTITRRSFARLPFWIQKHSDQLTRMIERLGCEQPGTGLIPWDSLDVEEQRLLNSAPHLVRLLILDTLQIAGAPPLPTVEGSLDNLQLDKQPARPLKLHFSEEERLQAWEQCERDVVRKAEEEAQPTKQGALRIGHSPSTQPEASKLRAAKYCWFAAAGTIGLSLLYYRYARKSPKQALLIKHKLKSA